MTILSKWEFLTDKRLWLIIILLSFIINVLHRFVDVVDTLLWIGFIISLSFCTYILHLLVVQSGHPQFRFIVVWLLTWQILFIINFYMQYYICILKLFRKYIIKLILRLYRCRKYMSILNFDKYILTLIIYLRKLYKKLSFSEKTEN